MTMMPTGSSSTPRRTLATGMLALAFVLLAVTTVPAVMSLGPDAAVNWGTPVGGVIWAVALMAFPVVGWLIARRDPSNLIGWLLLAVGVAAGLDFAAGEYSTRALEYGWPLGLAVANVGNWGWILWIGLVGVFITHLFPTGRPLSKRWGRWLVVLMVLLIAGAIGGALEPGPLEDDPRLSNPFGIESPIVELLAAALFALPVGVLSGAVSVVVRYRRGRDIERAQLRWFAAAAGLVAIGFGAVMMTSVLAWKDPLARPLWLGVFQDVVNVLWSAIPVAIGIAIFRYRLYAIDVVINRALVYGSLTAVLAVVYFGVVVALQFVLRPVAGEGELAIAGSTLVVAALFRPFRRRIQSFIDHRFYRARYDAQRLAESFASRMRQQVDLDGITAELEQSVRTAVHPASTSIWLRRN